MQCKKTCELILDDSLERRLETAINFFKKYGVQADSSQVTSAVSTQVLRQVCLAVSDIEEKIHLDSPIIRTVHHFACTGGTLICKCIASMPNTQLVGEIDPLTTMGQDRKNFLFNPTDIKGQFRLSSREIPDEAVINIFLDCIGALVAQCTSLGRFLVLRDHSHSHYCMGKAVAARPSFLEIIKKKFVCCSLVTVRNPIDSYLSLVSNKWLHFCPQTFDEYCFRYLSFLKSYDGISIIRYEDFISDPVSVMENICHIYRLPFNPDFMDIFSVHKLTGDSGRMGNVIAPRPRRTLTENLERQITDSLNFSELREMLNY